jgi:hypothetical protein
VTVKTRLTLNSDTEAINYVKFTSDSGATYEVGDSTQSNSQSSTVRFTQAFVGMLGLAGNDYLTTLGFFDLADQCNCLNTEFIP